MERKERKKKVPAYRQGLKLALRLGVTGLALYLVFRKADLAHVVNILQQANYLWLIPAWLLFVISKIISAFRLQLFFRCIGLHLNHIYNLKLYFAGMFYNLFLPGGIGGDGYKVYVLRKQYQLPVKQLISATLLDRVSGVGALGVLSLVALLMSITIQQWKEYQWMVWLALLASFPVYYFLMRLIFPRFMPVFFRSTWLAFIVQVLQVFSAMAILRSLHSLQYVADYVALFLLSSMAAMLPLTIGGVGAREAVFVILPDWIHAPVNENTAVTTSFLFFLVTAFSSLTGAFINLKSPSRKLPAT